MKFLITTVIPRKFSGYLNFMGHLYYVDCWVWFGSLLHINIDYRKTKLHLAHADTLHSSVAKQIHKESRR